MYANLRDSAVLPANRKGERSSEVAQILATEHKLKISPTICMFYQLVLYTPDLQMCLVQNYVKHLLRLRAAYEESGSETELLAFGKQYDETVIDKIIAASAAVQLCPKAESMQTVVLQHLEKLIAEVFCVWDMDERVSQHWAKMIVQSTKLTFGRHDGSQPKRQSRSDLDTTFLAESGGQGNTTPDYLEDYRDANEAFGGRATIDVKPIAREEKGRRSGALEKKTSLVISQPQIVKESSSNGSTVYAATVMSMSITLYAAMKSVYHELMDNYYLSKRVYIDSLISPDFFERVCRSCHQTLLLLMNSRKLEWKEFLRHVLQHSAEDDNAEQETVEKKTGDKLPQCNQPDDEKLEVELEAKAEETGENDKALDEVKIEKELYFEHLLSTSAATVTPARAPVSDPTSPRQPAASDSPSSPRTGDSSPRAPQGSFIVHSGKLETAAHNFQSIRRKRLYNSEPAPATPSIIRPETKPVQIPVSRNDTDPQIAEEHKPTPTESIDQTTPSLLSSVSKRRATGVKVQLLASFFSSPPQSPTAHLPITPLSSQRQNSTTTTPIDSSAPLTIPIISQQLADPPQPAHNSPDEGKEPEKADSKERGRTSVPPLQFGAMLPTLTEIMESSSSTTLQDSPRTESLKGKKMTEVFRYFWEQNKQHFSYVKHITTAVGEAWERSDEQGIATPGLGQPQEGGFFPDNTSEIIHQVLRGSAAKQHNQSEGRSSRNSTKGGLTWTRRRTIGNADEVAKPDGALPSNQTPTDSSAPARRLSRLSCPPSAEVGASVVATLLSPPPGDSARKSPDGSPTVVSPRKIGDSSEPLVEKNSPRAEEERLDTKIFHLARKIRAKRRHKPWAQLYQELMLSRPQFVNITKFVSPRGPVASADEVLSRPGAKVGEIQILWFGKSKLKRLKSVLRKHGILPEARGLVWQSLVYRLLVTSRRAPQPVPNELEAQAMNLMVGTRARTISKGRKRQSCPVCGLRTEDLANHPCRSATLAALDISGELPSPRSAYQDILKKYAGVGSANIEQIEKDLHRTFPQNEKYQSEEGIAALKRILVAYSWSNPEVGYCQSMNFLAGVLLLFMSEEEAYWVFHVIADILLPDYYTMQGVLVDSRVFIRLLGEKMPKLAEHFKRHDASIEPMIQHWFLCLWITVFPFEAALRALDGFFYEGSRMLFRIALALFRLNEKQLLMQTDGADLMQFVQSMPSTVDNASFWETAYARDPCSRTRLEEMRHQEREKIAPKEPKGRSKKSTKTVTETVPMEKELPREKDALAVAESEEGTDQSSEQKGAEKEPEEVKPHRYQEAEGEVDEDLQALAMTVVVPTRPGSKIIGTPCVPNDEGEIDPHAELVRNRALARSFAQLDPQFSVRFGSIYRVLSTED